MVAPAPQGIPLLRPSPRVRPGQVGPDPGRIFQAILSFHLTTDPEAIEVGVPYMRKMIALVAIVAMVAVTILPISALAVDAGEPSRTQSSYTGGNEQPPGAGDTDCLQTRDRLYQEDCEPTAECVGDQTQTRTQTRTQTQARVQAEVQTGQEQDVTEPVDAEVKAEVKAGALGEAPGSPEVTPVAAAVRAATQPETGFFGGIAAGLQRFALRLMAWVGLI